LNVEEGNLIVDSYVMFRDGAWINSNGMPLDERDPLMPVMNAILQAGAAFDGLYLTTDGESFVSEMNVSIDY